MRSSRKGNGLKRVEIVGAGLARLNAAVFNRLPDSLVDLSYRFVPGYGRTG
jgi:hypothetical protein